MRRVLLNFRGKLDTFPMAIEQSENCQKRPKIFFFTGVYEQQYTIFLSCRSSVSFSSAELVQSN